MTETESLALAHRILTEAGWRSIPKPPWNGLCAAPGLVGGYAPNGDQFAKAYTAFPQAMAPLMGLDPADYPDEAHEAAAWLVRHVQGRLAVPAEPAQIGAHDAHGEIPEAVEATAGGEDASRPDDRPRGLPGDDGGGADGGAVQAVPEGDVRLDETDSETVPEERASEGLGRSVGAGGDEIEGSAPDVDSADGVRESPQDAGRNDAESALEAPLDEIPEPVREEVGDAGAEASPSPVDIGADAAPEVGDGGAEDGAGDRGGDLLAASGPEGAGDSDEDILDAEYADIAANAGDLLALEDQSEPVALEGGDIDPLLIEAIAAEEAEAAPAEPDPAPNFSDGMRFYGLDDLDRRRSLRIGDVSRYAITLKAPWGPQEDARLVELRNFAMGVAEDRWPDDEELRAELTALESMLGRNNAIDQALQAKVTFLNGASREEVEAFVVEDGWP